MHLAEIRIKSNIFSKNRRNNMETSYEATIHDCTSYKTISENEVEDTTAAVLMVDKYGGKDTPGNMAVNTRLPTHAP